MILPLHPPPAGQMCATFLAALFMVGLACSFAGIFFGLTHFRPLLTFPLIFVARRQGLGRAVLFFLPCKWAEKIKMYFSVNIS